ncbi:MAG: response regulator [Bdellovibrionales bacterium]|nr:response regulator [Bdellovibrionales bacterium]
MSKSEKPLILILEDVPELREWLRSLIAASYPEWRIRTAGSATEFHQAIERERPKLAIMDEVLGPGEDLASLLKVAEGELIPVALMTGMDPAHRNPTRLPAGVLRRMIKPDWESGKGTEGFLKQVGEVIALTTRGPIG